MYQNHNETDIYIRTHQAKLRQEASDWRMRVHMAQADTRNQTRHIIYGPVLVRMGTILCRIGDGLQARYGVNTHHTGTWQRATNRR